MDPARCPFCNPRPDRIVLKNELAYTVRDVRPVSRGHMLLIPFRHIPGPFDSTPEEREALFAIAVLAKEVIDGKMLPDGYNLGVNIGDAAGQAIPHLHYHLIPRYQGDAGGRGSGMRYVIPRVRTLQRKLSEYYPMRSRPRRERDRPGA